MKTPRPDQERAVTSLFDFYGGSWKPGMNALVGMPTGYGKGLVQAFFVKRCMEYWPNQRFLLTTHVKELVQQNYNELLSIWPTAPAGIYSDGLNRRDTNHPIIFGGIQSMVGHESEFGFRNMMLVDEVHRISPEAETRYQKFITAETAINPYFTMAGFSATLYRTKQGKLTEGNGMFSNVVFDCTSLEEFNRILAEGWLCRLIPKATTEELQYAGVATGADGDYAKGQLQAAVDTPDVTMRCCKEIIEQGRSRKSWLIFAAGAKHAEHIAECMRMMGIQAEALTDKTKNRDELIQNFKNGTLRCLVNNDILTTGFDYPGLDLIAVMRPTRSPGLWVQILGRGTRPVYAPGYDLSTIEGRLWAMQAGPKPNCLVLDFAGNTKRLGPINDPVLPQRRTGKKGSSVGMAPIKICPGCGTYNHASVTQCGNTECSMLFSRDQKLAQSASELELIRQSGGEKMYEVYPVSNITYTKHTKPGSPPCLQVSYICGIKDQFKEFVFVEHLGGANTLAKKWWSERSSSPMPNSVDVALAQKQYLREPKFVKVWTNTKYPKIQEFIWEEAA